MISYLGSSTSQLQGYDSLMSAIPRSRCLLHPSCLVKLTIASELEDKGRPEPRDALNHRHLFWLLFGISPLLTFLPILWFLYPFFATSDCLGGLAERSRKDSKVRTQRVVEGYVFGYCWKCQQSCPHLSCTCPTPWKLPLPGRPRSRADKT